MIRHRLKPLRVCVALVSLFLTGFMFVDLWNLISPSTARFISYLHFVPSLLQFLNAPVLAASGFIAVIVLSVLFGRIYCSAVCPLGILQDAAARLSRKGRKKRRFRFSGAHNILRYSILVLTVILFIAGSGLLLNLLDPFSSFGRIMVNLLRPLGIAANNAVSIPLESAGVHVIPRMKNVVFAPLSFGVALGSLLLVVWFAVRHGRLYCNTLCPVGTLLGLLAKVSIFRIRIDPKACSGCTACERVCKANCIDSRNQTVDVSRCVACYNCLSVCNQDALHYGFGKVGNPAVVHSKSESAGPDSFDSNMSDSNLPDQGRRDFLTGSGMYFVGLASAAEPLKKILQSKPTTIPLRLTSPISPPGSISIDRFKSICTSCHLCVSACPSNVLVPSMFEFGLSGMMQPHMDFRAGHCNYECTECTKICPSGALIPLTVEEKKRTQLGTVKFIKENCVVYTDNTNCGACSEHCPTKAVDMVPYKNSANKKLVIPQIQPDKCVGCGGCEHACPTKPFKAIYVDGNPVHKVAAAPEVKQLNGTVDYKEDFPF
jgi:polyferredoxin